MEEKIEVREYVRLARNQGINKVIDKEDDRYILDSEIASESGDITEFLFECELKDEITKHSKQLIDLIEVGDILKIQTGLYDYFMKIIEDEDDLLVLKEQIKKYWSIKEVLSHEQYDWNCFSIDE